MKPRTKAVQLHRTQGSFDEAAYAVILTCSPVVNTRKAYSTDFAHWMAFAAERGIDPRNPAELDVAAWVEAMRKQKLAPKTRARRISALCTIYKKLKKRGAADTNPFSIEDGPEREKANAIAPTPVTDPSLAKKLVDTCDDSVLGKRDRAILRILWATGARLASLVGMTFERMRRTPGQTAVYDVKLIGKGDKEIQALVRGQAGLALRDWLAILADAKLSTGPIWRTKRGPMTTRAIGHMIDRRRKKAGIAERVSPHMFRVAFLTYNPASLEAKQAAAGHADPATTRLYDRTEFRGREAFEQMPEIEDAR